MTKVKWPMASFSAHGKVCEALDSALIDQSILEKDDNLIFQGGFILAENGEVIKQENDEKIKVETFPYTAIYREQPLPEGRVTIREKYYVPYNPQTEEQQMWRAIFAAAVAYWQSLSMEEQIVWNKKKYPPHMTGYNRCISYFLKLAS